MSRVAIIRKLADVARGLISSSSIVRLLTAAAFLWVAFGRCNIACGAAAADKERAFFLPSGDAAKIVSVTKGGEAQAGITIVTQAVAIKESGPAAAIKKFGEVYAFSPAFIAVHREEPTAIEFWNLQPDDEHDFALVGTDLKILMYVKLPPLQKTSFVFTFHREGLIAFKCLRHQPAMSGQILVMPPVAH